MRARRHLHHPQLLVAAGDKQGSLSLPASPYLSHPTCMLRVPAMTSIHHSQLLVAAGDKQGNLSLWHVDSEAIAAQASEPKEGEEEEDAYDGELLCSVGCRGRCVQGACCGTSIDSDTTAGQASEPKRGVGGGRVVWR